MRYAGSKPVGAGIVIGACRLPSGGVKLAVKRGGDVSVITADGETRFAAVAALVTNLGVLNYNGEFTYVSDDSV